MKIALMLAGFLFITLGEHALSAEYFDLKPIYDLASQTLEAEAKWREKEAEAKEKRLEKQAEAREKRLEKKAEAREKRLEAGAKLREKEAEAREKWLEAKAKLREEHAEARQFKVQLEELRQNCAKKGFFNDTDVGSTRQQIITNDVDGFRHIYVQTYSPKTKKVSGSYYKINLNDRNAEPICGKLTVESEQ